MFIIIEGIDGSGKSGLIDALTSFYPNYKRADIREQWAKVDAKSQTSRKKFFVDYYQQHKNDNIIVDRFHLSEAVYDLTLRNTKTDIADFEKKIFGNDVSNVILITIDVHEAVAQSRIKKRDGKDEKQDLAKERSIFLRLHNQSMIQHKLLVYNDKFDILVKEVKEKIEDVCGISGKVFTK